MPLNSPHLQALFALTPTLLRMVELIVHSTFGPRVGRGILSFWATPGRGARDSAACAACFAERRFESTWLRRGIHRAFLETGAKNGHGRPPQDVEGLVVVELADVLHDHQRVDPEREGEGGPDTSLLFVGQVAQRFEHLV